MSTAHDKKTLEDFALKGMAHAKMTGVMVATHGISDSFLLLHSGVGCKYKTASQSAVHDWGEHSNRREAWTQVAELELVHGVSGRVGPFARAWWERRHSALMVVVSAYFIELTGDDLGAAVREVEATLDNCPMVVVSTKAPNDGFFDGFAAVMHDVLARLDWTAPAKNDRGVTVLGNFFHRYEPDTKADVSQLKGLLKACGLETGAVLFSGQTWAETKTAPDARYVLTLPYTKPADKKLAKLLKGRKVIAADLPIGLAGTARFVQTVADAVGADRRKVDAWIKAQNDAVRTQLDNVSERFRNLKLAVYAETPLAAGVVTLLHEMGIRVVLVGLRDKAGCLGGREAFLETLSRNGVPVGDMEIFVDPSLRSTRERVSELLGRDALDGVIGSTHELDVLRHLPAQSARLTSAFLMEVGFPSDQHHAAFMMPTFGFTGAVIWAQRLLDAVHPARIGDANRLG